MIDPLLCLSSWEVKFASKEMVEGLDRLPVFLLGMIRETVHWLATEPGRVGLITDLMSSLAVGTGMHHVHLFDIVWVCLLALDLIATCNCRFTFLEDKRSNEHNMVLDVLRCISLSHDYVYGDLGMSVFRVITLAGGSRRFRKDFGHQVFGAVAGD
ncbi:hypothetical protein PIB30_019376 [Stylosanthes scabra]|uniref:Uncharacterized protein n=1 Tax=Stylosanthes scabra TaxID=79078 RepID=A0ABU6Y6M3_9FABA|nr:hypothetical protein [Stylosanthes scabra]